MITIDNITKHFAGFSLENISMDISRGEYVVLLGDSGSGKSVFLEILAGLISPDKGSVRLDGRELVGTSIRTRPFGMVFQDLALFPHLTVRENLAYPLKCRHLAKPEIESRTNEVAKKLEIEKVFNRYPASLSGGEKQRVALARTLITGPDCLLLDEPLSSLDARIRKEIKSVLRNLNRDGQTIIHVTHDYQEAISLASRIGIMEKGRLIRFGPALEVLMNPLNPFMANFTGIKNFVPVVLSADPSDGRIKAWTDQKIPLIFDTDKKRGKGYLVIPEDAVFLSNGPVETSAANQFRGVISDIYPALHGFEVVIDVGFALHAHLTADGVERLSVRTGNEVYASFKASSLRYINV